MVLLGSQFRSRLPLTVNQRYQSSGRSATAVLIPSFPFRLPPYYALIIRSLITLEGIALSVDSEFKILETIKSRCLEFKLSLLNSEVMEIVNYHFGDNIYNDIK